MNYVKCNIIKETNILNWIINISNIIIYVNFKARNINYFKIRIIIENNNILININKDN